MSDPTQQLGTLADILLATGWCLFMKSETLIKSFQVLFHATLPHSDSGRSIVKLWFFVSNSSSALIYIFWILQSVEVRDIEAFIYSFCILQIVEELYSIYFAERRSVFFASETSSALIYMLLHFAERRSERHWSFHIFSLHFAERRSERHWGWRMPISPWEGLPSSR